MSVTDPPDLATVIIIVTCRRVRGTRRELYQGLWTMNRINIMVFNRGTLTGIPLPPVKQPIGFTNNSNRWSKRATNMGREPVKRRIDTDKRGVLKQILLTRVFYMETMAICNSLELIMGLTEIPLARQPTLFD